MRKPCSNFFRPTASDRQTRTCRNTGWGRKRRPAFNRLLAFALFLGACTHIPGVPPEREAKETGPAIKEMDLSVCAPCSRDQAGQWAADAEVDAWSALKASNCYAFLVKTGTDRASRLADAKAGRQLADSAVQRQPGSGLAHYLYAYLTGLEAENDPLHGLELVTVIEREARLAAQLAPSIDAGGPDRMLGELYLRAPGMPISIGDVEKAIVYYRRALRIAPGFTENRLGLVEALLKERETTEACLELKAILSDMPPDKTIVPAWKKTLELLKRLCDMQDVN